MKPALASLSEVDLNATAERLARAGRAQVSGFLATAYAEHLLAEAQKAQFNVVTNGESGHLDFPSIWVSTLQGAQARELGRRIQATATTRFQYLFDNLPIYDLAQAGHGAQPWNDLVAFLNGEAFLGLMRRVTGEPGIALADAQLTRFRSGHFLTRHDDEAHGKNRYFAYVLSLCPAWNADWGGLLAFHDEAGNLSEAFTPRFNTLNLLRVPQPHSVTQVSLFAGGDRLSVTGWLRGA